MSSLFQISMKVLVQIKHFSYFTRGRESFKMSSSEEKITLERIKMNQTVREKKLEKGQIVPITFDYVFCNIFNNPDNMIILENFLSCYLEVPLKKIRGQVEILSRNLIIENKKEANKQIDLLVDIEGEKVNIELQNKRSEGIINRNVVFACKVHARGLKLKTSNGKKDSYSKYTAIKRTLQINLMRGKNTKKIKESYFLTNEEGEILTKKFQIDLVNMEKAREICYTKEETKLARWCTVIMATTKEEFEKALGEDLMEKEARDLLEEKVEQYSRDEEVIEMYSEYSRAELERESVLEEAIEKATKQGIEKGAQKNRIEIAKRMLDEKLDENTISRITGFSLQEIEKLG